MTISRRTLVRGSAWAAPAILATTTIPAYAASPTCPTLDIMQKDIYDKSFSASIRLTGLKDHQSVTFTVADGVFTEPIWGNFTASADGKVLTFTNAEKLDVLWEVFTVETEAQEAVITYQAGPSCLGSFTIGKPSETCLTETDITFSSDYRTPASGLPVLSLDETNNILLEVTSMPADARIIANYTVFDTSAVDTSLWRVVSETELAYIGEPEVALSTHLPLASTGLEMNNIFVSPTHYAFKSKDWGDACQVYGVPVDGYDCLNSFEGPKSEKYFDVVLIQSPSPSLTLISADCQVQKKSDFQVDHTQKPSHIDFTIENVTVTADEISFDFTGSLYGLIVYTTANDGEPVNHGPAQLTNIMGLMGYFGYSTSDEYFDGRITIPLSGERVPDVIIGKAKYDHTIDHVFPYYKTTENTYFEMIGQ